MTSILFWYLIWILVLIFFPFHPTIKPLGAAHIGKKGRATEDPLRRATDIVTLQKNVKEKNVKQFCLYCRI